MAATLLLDLALGSSQTGLTLSAQLLDTAGANVGSAVSSGFYEIGAGNYSWYYTAYPDAFRGSVVFKVGATVKASVALNPQDFVLPASTGTGGNAVTLTVNDGTNPVPGLAVTIKNSGQTATIAGPALTDANGQIVFSLADGTYTVLINTGTAYTPFTPATLVVSGTTTHTYSLTGFSPTTGAPGTCTVFGWLYRPSGNAAANSTVSFKLLNGCKSNAGPLVKVISAVTTTTDSNGYFAAQLTISANLTALGDGSTQYLMECDDAGVSALITVPNQASVDWKNLVA